MNKKLEIKELLSKSPNGLKAREISKKLPHLDKKEVNQILYANTNEFVCNDCYEWTLNKKTVRSNQQSSIITREDIKKLFPDAYIDNDTFQLLKSKTHSDLNMYKARFVELSQIINRYNCLCFKTLIEKAILVSEENFNQILERTKRLNNFYTLRKFEEWELLIFSSRFDELCSNIQSLQKNKFLNELSTDFYKSDIWMKIINKRADKFKEFMNRVEELSNVQEDYVEYEIVELALDKNFSKFQHRIQKIVAQQSKKKFPKLYWFYHQLKTLLTIKEEDFERCLKQSKELYDNKANVIREISWPFTHTERAIFDIVLLSKEKFNLICDNIASYTYSSLIESFEYNEWLEFFLNGREMFVQAMKNISMLEAAISDKEVLSQPRDEKIRCMWLSSQDF